MADTFWMNSFIFSILPDSHVSLHLLYHLDLLSVSSNRAKITCLQNMFLNFKMRPKDPDRPLSTMMTRFLSGSVPSLSLSSTS